MTVQESIFEVAKALYLIDKVACFNQLSKINFNELTVLFGKDSEIDTDIRGLMLFLAITENIPNNINLPDEIMKIYGSQNTHMFTDTKAFATYMFNIAVDKELISRSSLNLPKEYKITLPNIEVRSSFNYITNSEDVIKDDIIKLIDLFDRNLLVKDRLDSFIPDGNSDNLLYSLKVKFSVKRNMFDYGIKNIKLLLDSGIDDIQPIILFLQNFIPLRGIDDQSIIDIIALVRSKIQNTKNEMTLDSVLLLLEYQSLTLDALKKSNIKERIQKAINRYTNLGFNTRTLKEMLVLKGL